MSIWRTISCPKCDSWEKFSIADNSFDLKLRVICEVCEHKFFVQPDGKEWTQYEIISSEQIQRRKKNE